MKSPAVFILFACVAVLASTCLAHKNTSATHKELPEESALTCSEMKSLVTATGLTSSWVDVSICIAWIESRWVPTAANPSGAKGLWQFMPLWVGKGDCPSTDSGFFDPKASAKCMAWVIKNYGGSAWNPDTTECQSCVAGHGCPGTSQGYPGCH